jgi:hypothetical protein
LNPVAPGHTTISLNTISLLSKTSLTNTNMIILRQIHKPCVLLEQPGVYEREPLIYPFLVIHPFVT